jgi:Gpi18-like mannosyltransferase
MSLERAFTPDGPASKLTARTAAILTAISVAALAVRFPLRDFVVFDYTWYFGSWYRALQENGGLLALRLPISNYTPPYLYLMILTNAVLPFAYPLHAVKIISVIFDFLCAFGALATIRDLTHSDLKAWVGYAAVLFCPTVVANSALWGQVDAIFTAFMVLSVWRLARHDRLGALLFYGLSFAFKFQAVFLAPLFLFLVLDGFFRWQDMLIIPSLYLAVNVPAVLLGRSPIDILTLYYGQVGQFSNLTMNGPSIYQWLPAQPASLLSNAGILAAALFVLGLLVLLRRSGTPVTAQLLPVSMALLMGIPLLLPYMHDRYFFPADVLSIVTACVNRRLRWLPFPIVAGSALAYAATLGFIHNVPLGYATALIFIAWLALIVIIFRSTRANRVRAAHVPMQQRAGRRVSGKFVYIFAAVSVVAYCLAIPVGQGMAATFDQATIAATLSYADARIMLRSPVAIRCQDHIRVDMTWTDTSNVERIEGAHVFVHGLDDGQTLVAQSDGPMPMDFLMDRPVHDRRNITTAGLQNITQVQIGLYQFDTMQRYQAQKVDGTLWFDNAIVVPVRDGPCGW